VATLPIKSPTTLSFSISRRDRKYSASKNLNKEKRNLKEDKKKCKN